MNAVIEINGYAEVAPVAGGTPAFRPLANANSVRVHSLPATVVLRAVWRTEPGDDEPAGFMPFARLLLAHAEPGEEPAPPLLPELFRSPLERWDGASIIFAAYTLQLHTAGEHRLSFPRVELAEMTLPVRIDE